MAYMLFMYKQNLNEMGDFYFHETQVHNMTDIFDSCF